MKIKGIKIYVFLDFKIKIDIKIISNYSKFLSILIIFKYDIEDNILNNFFFLFIINYLFLIIIIKQLINILSDIRYYIILSNIIILIKKNNFCLKTFSNVF